MMFDSLKLEMKNYYDGMIDDCGCLRDKKQEERVETVCKTIYTQMDAYWAQHPEISPVRLKSRLHTLIAQYAQPVIFDENPFFFEIGMRPGNSWGFSNHKFPAPWLRIREAERVLREHPVYLELENQYLKAFIERDGAGLCSVSAPFDADHHTLGYKKLFRSGICGIIEEANAKIQTEPEDSQTYDFALAVVESCTALLDIAKKFALEAEKRLPYANTEKAKKYLSMMAKTADHIPAQPPKTFYEGLAMLLFTREVTGTLEDMGISSFGQADLLLGELYEQDLAEERITEAEARELIYLWMMHTDIKFDLENNSWPETSTCVQLGGCDRDGNPVYNEVTRLFIEVHLESKLLNPKLNCRYSSLSPQWYLELIGKAVLKGHNHFVLINDDVIIPALVGNGVEIEDARGYVNGGCQETMIEGCGHTEGAALYVSMPRILDIFLRPDTSLSFLKSVDHAESFEAFYGAFMQDMEIFFSVMTDLRNIRQSFMKDVDTCPLFSATQEGCIESGKNYAHGGSKYNFSTIALTGLGTMVDSLLAIKRFVYDDKCVTLKELINVLADNWEGHEKLRREALSMEKYGHGISEVDSFANRFLGDVTTIIRNKKNERGGTYIPSLFVYYYFSNFAKFLRATPDGRKDYDLISPGCAPSQMQSVKDVTDPIRTMSSVDFTTCGGGNAVLDMMFPLSSKSAEEIFAAFARSCGELKCPTLQPNVVSVKDMMDAKIHPEKHKDLVVRISGLSAYFVALEPHVQDEIISRNLYEM